MSAVLLGVFAALCWSVHDVFARTLAVRVGPFRMAALMMVAGALLLTGFVLWNGTVWTASRAGLLLSLALGLAYGFGVGGLFKAFSLGPVSLVAPLSASYPVIVVFWGLFNGLTPSAAQWLAVAVTIGGAVIVARAGGAENAGRMMSRRNLTIFVIFCLLSNLGFSASVILGQHAAVAMGEIEAAWISRPIALLTIVPFCFGEAKPSTLQRRHWLGILAMGAFDVMGVTAINASGHLPDREFAAVGISAYGAIAVILAMLFLKEKVFPGQWLGIALIVAGVATLSVSQ